MERHEALVPLSRQHHRLLLLAQVLRKDVPVYKDMIDNPGAIAQLVGDEWVGYIKQLLLTERKVVLPAAGSHHQLAEIAAQLAQEQEALISFFEQTKHQEANREVQHRLGIQIQHYVRRLEREFLQELQDALSHKELEQLGDQLGALLPPMPAQQS